MLRCHMPCSPTGGEPAVHRARPQVVPCERSTSERGGSNARPLRPVEMCRFETRASRDTSGVHGDRTRHTDLARICRHQGTWHPKSGRRRSRPPAGYPALPFSTRRRLPAGSSSRKISTRGGGRTHKPFRALGFEPSVSASSTTRAGLTRADPGTRTRYLSITSRAHVLMCLTGMCMRTRGGIRTPNISGLSGAPLPVGLREQVLGL